MSEGVLQNVKVGDRLTLRRKGRRLFFVVRVTSVNDETVICDRRTFRVKDGSQVTHGKTVRCFATPATQSEIESHGRDFVIGLLQMRAAVGDLENAYKDLRAYFNGGANLP